VVKKRLKILSEFKTSQPLFQVDKIKVLIPYENGSTLEKNNVDIISHEDGIVELTLSDFEFEGVKADKGQNFKAEVYMKNGDMLTVLFAGGLNVGFENNRKVWL